MSTKNPDESTRSDGLGLKRLLLFGGLFIVLSIAGSYVIYDQIAGRSFTFDSRLLSWPVLLGVTLLLVIYFTTDGLRLYYILRALGHNLSPGCIFRLVFINIFVSNVTPLATGGGFAQIWYLRNRGVPLGTATAATTIRTMLAVVFIFSATPVLLISLDALTGVGFGGQLMFYLTLFVAAYLGFFLVVMFRTRWLLALLNGLLRWLCRCRLISPARYRHWRTHSQSELIHFHEGFRQYLKGSPVNILLSIVFTFIFLLSLFSFPALLLWGLSYEVNYLSIVGLLVVVTFVLYFSPTPGASGIAEGVFSHFFAGLVTANHLVLVTVAWRFLTIYMGMIIGVMVTHAELTRQRSLRAQT